MAPAALSLIMVIFTDLKELNKAFAIFGAVAGSSSAHRPDAGRGADRLRQLALDACTSTSSFAVVGIVGALALLHNSAEPDKPKLSVPSTILGTAGVFGLVFGASKAETDGWGAAHHPDLRSSPAASC